MSIPLGLKPRNKIGLMARLNSSIDPPRVVHWSDGSPATHNDYLTHMEDTHTYVGGIDGMELHIFPDIVADVRYDRFARTWVINGVDVRSAALNLTDPAALDDHIEAGLYTYSVVTGLGFTSDRP